MTLVFFRLIVRPKAIFFKAFKENVMYELKLEKEGEKLDKNHLPFKWKWQIIDSCLVTQ